MVLVWNHSFSYHYYYNSDNDTAIPRTLAAAAPPLLLPSVVLEYDRMGLDILLYQTTMIRPPQPLGVVGGVREEKSDHPDHGGLVFEPVIGSSSREIKPDDLEQFAHEVEQHLAAMDEAADGDTDHWYESFDDLGDQSQYKCRHLSWSYTMHPSCNTFHEHVVLDASPQHPLQPFDVQFLDAGGFREARLLVPKTTKNTAAAVVLKTLLYERDPDERSSVRGVQKEAHLLDRLQPTGLFSHIYGHCGTSVLVEKGSEIYQDIIPEDTQHVSRQALAALQRDRGVMSMNHLTDSQKVAMALAMAQSLAALHELGVVHSDVTMYQWLRSGDNDQRIMLNDVNSAEIQMWNDATGQYCPYWSRYDWGRYKAPEEYVGGYFDASVDVWAMGNLLYGLLTGELLS
jgi:hypothetical protein